MPVIHVPLSRVGKKCPLEWSAVLGVTGRDALGVSETGRRIKGAMLLGAGERGAAGEPDHAFISWR